MKPKAVLLYDKTFKIAFDRNEKDDRKDHLFILIIIRMRFFMTVLLFNL